MKDYKRISSRRTNKGYSVTVFMRNGDHLKPIIEVLERYFSWVNGDLSWQKQEQIKLEVEDEAQRLPAYSQG